MSDLGFSFRVRKSGDVSISRAGREVTILRGAAAHAFHAQMAGSTAAEQQQAMAKVTGEYRRGNETAALRHPRNR